MTLQALFPDIGLDTNPLLRNSRSLHPFLLSPPLPSSPNPSFSYFLVFSFSPFYEYFIALWNSTHDRRKFFENFAKENNFNPLNPRNWHSRLRAKVVATEVNVGD
jgi:hypothetical protein